MEPLSGSDFNANWKGCNRRMIVIGAHCVNNIFAAAYCLTFDKHVDIWKVPSNTNSLNAFRRWCIICSKLYMMLLQGDPGDRVPWLV